MTLRTPTKTYVVFNVASFLLLLNGLLTVLARDLPRHLKEAGHFQFFTNLSLLATIVSLAVDLVSVVLFPSIRDISSYMVLTSLVLEFLVTVIYWSLKLLFVHLIVNIDEVPVENFIPLTLDLTIHFAPLVVLTIDILLLRKKQQKKQYFLIFSIVLSLAIGYWILLESLITKARLVNPQAEYPYPFLNVDFGARMVIFGGVSVIGIVVVVVVEALSEWIEYHYEKRKTE